MTLKEIKRLCDDAVNGGLMFEQNSVMINTANGANYSAIAVLGTLLINVSKQAFNQYLDVQVGWLSSFRWKNDEIAEKAHKLKQQYRLGNPATKSMFVDAEQKFINLLFTVHIDSGGKLITVQQKEATCSMLLAKIFWDLRLGNETLARHIRMLKSSL